MGAVLLTARARIRRGLPATVALVVLVGLAGGIVLTSLAGARRTESAFPRMLDDTAAADAVGGGQIEALGLDMSDIAVMPGVERAGSVLGYGLFQVSPDGEPVFDSGYFATAPVDGVVYQQLSRPLVLDGRLPDPARADEVLLNETAMQEADLEVGDRLDTLLFNFTEIEAKEAELAGRQPTEAEIAEVFDDVALTVVGVGRFPWEVVSDENERGEAAVVLTPAFARAHPDRESYDLAHVDLADPSDMGAFQAQLQARHPEIGLDLDTKSSRLDAVAAATTPYASALELFSLALGLTALLVIGQAIARWTIVGAEEGTAHRALGMTRWQRTGAALAGTAVVAVPGAVLAALVAVALSPMFPIGPARLAEPQPGLHVDAEIVGIGALVIVVLLLARAALAANRATVAAPSSADPSPERTRLQLADRLAGAGLPAAAATGLRMALVPRSREGQRSMVTTLVGLTVASAAITASLTFGAGLDRLVSSPSDYGWRWDAMIDDFEDGDTEAIAAALEQDHDVAGFTVGARGTITMGDRSIPAYGFDRRTGEVLPPIDQGREPEGPGEVVLGQQTLDALGVGVGDTVGAVASDGEGVDLRIVGRAVFPALSLGESNRLSEGAMLTFEGMRRLAGLDPSFLLVDVAPGVGLGDIEARYGEDMAVYGPQKPGDILSYEQVRDLPLLLAGVLAALGLGVLGHALAMSVRERRRELAVLRTIGFVRGQVTAAVRWQATTLTLVALVVGVPLGLATGRWVWQLFVTDLGAGRTPVTPAIGLAALVAASLALAGLLAIWPARRAQSMPAAAVLRAD